MMNYYFNLLIYSFLQLVNCNYKRNKLCCLFICLILYYNQAKAQQSGYELAYQETFEAPLSAPWVSTGTTSWDSTQWVSPTHSLNYTRTSTTGAPALGLKVNLIPGQSCYATVMMKTANLSVGTQGGKMYMEAYNSAGGFLGGTYGASFRGTNWTEVRIGPFNVPASTSTLRVSLTMDTGVTGTVWFDDFKVFATPNNTLASKMVTPSYRGLLMDNEYDQIELSSKLLKNTANTYTRVKLLDVNDQIIATQTSAVGQTPFTSIFPTASLESGSYKVLAEAVDNATQQTVDSNVYTIKKLGAGDAKPKNYVDKYGRLIVDGQPYFTLGTYNGTLFDEVINDHKNSAFNTVISYQNVTSSMLNKLQTVGIKILYNTKKYYNYTGQQQTDSVAKFINQYKDHPALLGWYTNDETNTGVYGEQMLNQQRTIEAVDYNHPTYGVDLTLPLGEFMTKAADMFGTDAYPIHNDASSLSNPGEWTKFVKNELPHRAPMTVIQTFKWGGANNRFPTIAEVRSMSWQSIAEGATGLMFYNYWEVVPDAILFANMKQVGKEIKAMAPAILSIEQVPTVTITGGGTWMNWTVRKYNNRVYVIVANNQRTARQGVSFNVPDGSAVKVLNENRTLPVTGGIFTDSFDPIAVHVYEVSLGRGNVSPTVSISTPVNNSGFAENSTINIAATANDADGSIAKVEFFSGDTKLGEVTSSPYNFAWTNVPSGTYVVTAKVWDNNGIFTVSDVLNVTVSPIVKGTLAPVADAYVRDGSTNVNTNFGTVTTLAVKNDSSGGFNRATYLKFDLNGVNDFDKATLRLNVATAGGSVPNTQWQVYYVPTDSWTETGITWTNKPTEGTLLATITGQSRGWVEWDVSAQALAELGADKVLSLKIVSTLNHNAAGVDFISKEATDATLRPQLLLTSKSGVLITSPATGSVFNGGGTITITANATDATGTVTKVEFFEGTNKIGESTTSPYSFNWISVPAGNHNLTAKVTNSTGEIRTSNVITITVNASPTVALTSPSNNAVFKDPATIIINANAADADGSVSMVEFFAGTTKLGEDLTAPYSFTWNNVTEGNYALTAKVTDNIGSTVTSEAVNIIVSPPTYITNGDLSPIADAYVRDGSANVNTNFGTAATIQVKNDTSGGVMREAYLKFDLNGVSNFEKATLRLNIAASNTTTSNTTWQVYYVPTDSWTETGITWTNKPASSTLLTTINGKGSGLVEWEITPQALVELGADKVLSLKIVSTLNNQLANVDFHSKEAVNTTLRPQLLLVTKDKIPVVSLTSPSNGASFNAPATIAITANATDTDGTITKVEFFEGANKLGEATAAPYTFNWNNVAAGTYNLSTKATDNDGVVSTSAVTNITVNATPTVSITSPVAGASFNAPTTIAITANAADADGTISKVEFYQGSTKLGEDLTAPYSFNWTGATAGNYAITAKATDNNGAVTTSSQVSVSVNSVLGPIADAYVRDGSANINTNYGTSTALFLKKDGTGYSREIFMKFDLSSISSFSTAKLRLNLSYANTNASATTWSVYYVSSDSWTETGVNWSNKPASGTLIATISGQGSGWAEWNISSQALSELAGDKILSLRIVSNVLNSTSDVTFNSKEVSNSNLRPQLLLQPSGTGSKMTLDKNYNALVQNEIASEKTVDDSDIKLYPNPVYDKFNVALSKLGANATISIYNVLGAKMSDVRFTSLPQEVSVESLPTGTYYVVIQNGKEIFNRVIIKK